VGQKVCSLPNILKNSSGTPIALAEESKAPCHLQESFFFKHQDTNDTLFFDWAELLAASLPLIVERHTSGSAPISCQLLPAVHQPSTI
jgi:hypothetical protein